MSTPVLVDGHAYVHLANGRVCCVDLASSEWTRTGKPLGEYWNLLTNNEKILALGQKGGGQSFSCGNWGNRCLQEGGARCAVNPRRSLDG